MDEKNILIFEDKHIRTAWDTGEQKRYFSIVDICAALNDSEYQTARNYWKWLKNKLKGIEKESVSITNQLKIKSSDGKYYNADVANTEQLLRIIDYIPSPKTEQFKVWLASAEKNTPHNGISESSPVKPNIQNSKYTPPPLPEIYAPREEVLEQIERAAKKKIVYIGAPAGSGKTVSTLLWLKKSNRKTVWIGLDEFDNSPAVFYRMFCTGILSVQPDNEYMAAVLRDPAFDSSPVEHTINLLAGFALDGREYVLVMDGTHYFTNPEILKAAEYIIPRMPHSFVIFILNHGKIRKPLTDFAADGQVTVIPPEALAFTKEEIGDYFNALGRDITGKEAETIHAFTSGWAIGVNALAQSIAPVPEARARSAGFGGFHLENYITKYIWDEWDKPLQAFILASAALDEMPVPLCKKITGRTDAGELLERLRAQNIFVTRVEDGIYRYHHLFLAYLRTRPEYSEADKEKSWDTAAEYYLKKEKHIMTAIKYSLKCGNIKIKISVSEIFLNKHGYSLDEYLECCKEFYRSDNIDALCEKYPIFYTGCVWAAFLSGDASSYEKYQDKLKQSLPAILLKYARFAELAISFLAMDYRTPIAKLLSQTTFFPSVGIERETAIVSAYSVPGPFLHRGIRDFYEMTDTAVSKKFKKVCAKLLKNHCELLMSTIGAGIFLEQNRVNDALSEARTAVSLLNPQMSINIRFAAYMQLAAIYFAMGNQKSYFEHIEETEQFVYAEAQVLRPNFLAFTARVKIWDGDAQAAREWLDNYFFVEPETLKTYRIYQYFTTVRAHAVLGDFEKAKDLAVRLRQMGKDFRRPQDAIEAGVLLSVILWAHGDKEEAQELMETVFLEMQPHGFVRLIADEGAAVLSVLKKVLGKIEHMSYQGKLDRIYVKNVYITAYEVSKQRVGIISKSLEKPVKLSKQQKMTVQLLAQGYKREDIVNKTGLSLSTVKTHILLAYEKLGVTNTADAAVKARELGIIE